MTTRIFKLYFLRDQNSEYFNEGLLKINASTFSFVLCFKAINYAGSDDIARRLGRVHSLSSGKCEMFLCVSCHAFTPHVSAWKN